MQRLPGEDGVIPARVLRNLLFYTVSVLSSLFIMINVHEIGHTVFARLFGDSQATYYLYRLSSDGTLACIGCNEYDEASLPLAGNIVVTLGGVIFSQIMAAAMLVQKRKSKKKCRFCHVLAVVCVFDVVFQVGQGIIENTVRQTGLTRVDIADFVWLVANRTRVSHAVLKGSVLAGLVVYLLWFAVLYRRADAAGTHRQE